ncbi:MAG: ADP-ribosylglycohydrolase family protein [Rubrobacter sp.]|nr:ADP-ribosylglycohydrolase family protein [Rubrobacter sp.]MDQ3637162.1 ADP-ribosylglycohydrolase family protein [Actinomycetota bacterium]
MPDELRYSGSLIGQCLGDALGFVVEGEPPEVCREYVEETLKAGRAVEHGRDPFPFGQYSDDSQLARELLQSYAERGRFDPRDYARRIAMIFVENRIVGRGRATEQAAWRLAAGAPWEEAGTPSPSAGNGSAMRAGPIGLLFSEDTKNMVRAVHDQGRITHRDPRCSAGAVAIAGAVAMAVRSEEIETEQFLSQLAEWAAPFEESVADALRQLVEWVPLPAEEAATLVSGIGHNPDYPDEVRGISPFVTTSVLWSLYSFLRSPGDYWETVCTAIGVGGDVDTTAAMAGAISGAYLGLDAIPQGWARYVTDRGTWGYDELVELAHHCHRLKTRI